MFTSPQIFLSYAREDQEEARKIYEYLTSANLNVWMDEERIYPGNLWEEKIKKAIDESEYFLACTSRTSVNKKGFIQKEWRYALDRREYHPSYHEFFIPLRLDSYELPTHFPQEIHYHDWFKPNHRRQLVDSLTNNIKYVEKQKYAIYYSSAKSQAIKEWRLPDYQGYYNFFVNSVEFVPNQIHHDIKDTQFAASVLGVEGGGHVYLGYGHHIQHASLDARFNKKGSLLALAREDGTVSIYDVWNRSVEDIGKHNARVTSVCFSPDEKCLLTSSDDNTVVIWELETKAKKTSFTGHEEGLVGNTGSKYYPMRSYTGVDQASFSPDGSLVVSASYDGTARIWETETAQEIRVLKEHDGWVMGACFSHDGQLVATSGRDSKCVIWDAGSGEQLVHLIGHNRWIRRAKFSPDNRHVVTMSDDCTLRIWETSSGQEVGRLSFGNLVLDAAFSKDGSYLLAGSIGRASLWHFKELID